MARLFARKGYDVLAIDGDVNPNLALTLGLSREEASEVSPLPGELLGERVGPTGNRQLVLNVSPATIAQEYGVKTTDGVTLLVMGKAEHAGVGCMCHSHSTARELLGELVAEDDKVAIIDTEASLEHLTRGTARHVDTMLIVTEPYYKSLETAVRIRALAAELGIERIYAVANKVKDPRNEEAIREFLKKHDLNFIGTIPYDANVLEADAIGVAPLDYDASSEAVVHIQTLAEELERMRVSA